MKISQGAREAAAEWAFLFRAGKATSEFEAAMQSLINSTLEHAADTARRKALMMCKPDDIATAIRQLMESE